VISLIHATSRRSAATLEIRPRCPQRAHRDRRQDFHRRQRSCRSATRFANILRLNGHSQANIASLTDKEIQIQVSQGSATYTAFKTSEIRPEVDAANLSVRPSKGDVSFPHRSDSPDETEVTVRKGEAEVSTSSGSPAGPQGRMIVVRGSGADSEFKVETGRIATIGTSERCRDHLIRDAEGVHRTSPYYTGSQDLDAYGIGPNAGLRIGLGPFGIGGLGSVSRRPLGLGAVLRMDVGFV